MAEKKEDEIKGDFRGAEAILRFESERVLKERVRKGYRNESIDVKLRKERTRIEFRILKKLYEKGIPCPKPLEIDEKKALLIMERIKGKRVRDVLNQGNVKEIARRMADIIADMHNQGIVHQDLTTSNFLINDSKRVFIIDFGLSFFSEKVEDKAVDIHLLERAIESKHPEVNKAFMEAFWEEYSERCKNTEEIAKRLKKVEKRGRYKNKNREKK